MRRPYGHRLLGIDLDRSHEFEREITGGCEGIKPGWVRVNFNYFIDEDTFEYILDAVDLVADRGLASPARTTGSSPTPVCGSTGSGDRSSRAMSLHEVTYDVGRHGVPDHRQRTELIDLAALPRRRPARCWPGASPPDGAAAPPRPPPTSNTSAGSPIPRTWASADLLDPPAGATTTLARMTDMPWQGDVVSLVDAFRAGERSPVEEVEATLAAIDRSDLNAVCHVDPEAALAAAAAADTTLPFGGVAIGVKELDRVEGWPDTHASVPFDDDIATYTDTKIDRLTDAGGVFIAQTTSSEFGGVNQTYTKLHGATRNPWNPDRTPGGSSGGSAAGVAGGLFPIATGGDGGGSIRIPAGFTGLFGLKSTFGRISRGPQVGPGNLTVVAGCVSRSVRDTARWFDVSNGFDPRDPLTLPRVEGWEDGLGSFIDQLAGRRAAVIPEFAGAVVAPETLALVTEAAEWLIGAAGLARRTSRSPFPEPATPGA